MMAVISDSLGAFWPVITRLLAGGVIVGVVALLLGIVLRRSARAREITWRAAVIVLLALAAAPFVVSWRWSLPVADSWSVVSRREAASRRLRPSSTLGETTAGSFGPEAIPEDRPEAGRDRADSMQPAGAFGSGERSAAGRLVDSDRRLSTSAREHWSSTISGSLPELAVLLWAAVTVAMLLRLSMGWATLQLHARRATDVTYVVLTEELSLRLRRRVRVLRGGPFRIPICWGVLRPTVLLPSGSEAWSPETTRAVLLHETAHSERSDALHHLTARLACALHWPNPLAWIVTHLLSRDAEAACDSRVVGAGVSRRAYARILVEIAAESRRAPGAGLAISIGSSGGLTWRVTKVLESRRESGRRGAAVAAPLALVITGFAGATVQTDGPRATIDVPSRVVADVGVSIDTVEPADVDSGPGPAARFNAAVTTIERGPNGITADSVRDAVVRALVGALSDSAAGVRRSAMNSLRDLGDPTGIEAVRPLLDDPEPELRRVAAEVLGLRAPSPNLLLPSSRHPDPIPPDSLERILALLDGEDGGTRLRAANALGNARDSRAVLPLADRLNDPDIGVRIVAANALGNIGSTTAVPALVAAHEDRHSDVLRAIVAALGNIGDARAVPVLLSAYPGADSDLRRAIASALGAIGDVRAARVLISAISDPDEHVRRQAAESLGSLSISAHADSTAAAGTRLTVRDADSPGVRACTAGEVQRTWSARTLSEASRVLLADPDQTRREAAAWEIGRLADSTRLGAPQDPAETAGKDHHHALIAAASDPAMEVRLASICSLALVGDSRALEVLGWRTAEREDLAVRSAAGWAIESIRERSTGDPR